MTHNSITSSETIFRDAWIKGYKASQLLFESGQLLEQSFKLAQRAINKNKLFCHAISRLNKRGCNQEFDGQKFDVSLKEEISHAAILARDITNQAIEFAIEIRSIVGNEFGGSCYMKRTPSHQKTMQDIACELQSLSQWKEINFPGNFEHRQEIEIIQISIDKMKINAVENIRLAIEAAIAIERIAVQAGTFVRKL